MIYQAPHTVDVDQASVAKATATLSTDKWTGKLYPSKNFKGKSVSLSYDFVKLFMGF